MLFENLHAMKRIDFRCFPSSGSPGLAITDLTEIQNVANHLILMSTPDTSVSAISSNAFSNVSIVSLSGIQVLADTFDASSLRLMLIIPIP